MKANQSIKKIHSDNRGYTKVVGGLVALLLAIVIGIIVFYETYDTIDAFDSTTTETFDGYTLATQYLSTFSVTLDNSPASAADCNVTFYNSTLANIVGYPTPATHFHLNNTVLTILGGTADDPFDQINVTYTTHASNDGLETNDMAGTVFTLSPLIALVIVAAIILGIIIGFGRSKRGGGL